MSASDKKKLRKEQYEQKLTDRQKQEQVDAKKLRVATISFVVAMFAVVCLFVGIGVYKFWTQNGITQRMTTAATITTPSGTTYKMSTVDLSYYYQDTINEQVGSIYGQSYADVYFEYMQLDLNQSLATQTNPETGKTWSDTFLDYAFETAQSDYALYDLAMKEGFTLSAEEQAALDAEVAQIEASGDAKLYLSNIYGPGANLKNFREYRERRVIAQSYYNAKYDSLTFDDAALRAHEKGIEDNYNTYTYAYSYLSYKDFLEGGTKNEDGTTEYTEAENDAARAKAKEAAEMLAKATSAEEMKEIIKEIKINESSQLAVNQEDNQLHTTASGRNDDLAKWLADDARTKNEIGVIEVTAEVEVKEEATEETTEETTEENTEEATEEEVTEETTEEEAEEEATEEKTEEEETVQMTEDGKKIVTNGYYVVCFHEKNDNTAPMDNVRHILVQPEGGHLDDATGETVYTTAELTVAENDAKKILDQWKNGAATEESFIALVKEHSADTASVENGGLYEDIHPRSEYMENFRAWAIDPARKSGDTGMVSTDYGWHIMYYVGESDMSYRDQMISDELRSEAQNTWYENSVAAVKVERKNVNKLEREFLALAYTGV